MSFEDPRGEYPTPKYWNSSSLNKEVTGQEKTEVDVGGGDPGLSAFGGSGPDVASQYGKVQVQESPSGHKTVIDDTPGNERMVFSHKSGAGIEMAADGSVNIRARNNMIIAIDADGAIIIEGDFRISSKSLEVDVTGDLDLNITGDMNMTVAGNKTEKIYGHDRSNVMGNQSNTVTGSKSETIVGSVTDTTLGVKTEVVKGDRNFTTGGNSTMSVGGTFKASATGEYTLAAPSMNLSAADMSILGSQGTIGGGNVIMYNYNMYTQKSVYAETMDATTFHGDLNGTAADALAANVAAAPGGGGASTTVTALDTKATYMPDAALMTQILSYSTRGVNEVSIDSKNYIKNKIDRAANMGGIANRKLSPEEARMKLKDSINAANADFVAALVKDGSVDPSYFSKKVPPAVGRSYSGTGSVAFTGQGNTSSSAGSGSNYYLTGSRTFEGFSPDPEFNPQAIDPRNGPLSITAKTLVGNGIPISTYLGSKGFATNLSHLATLEERQTLARHLVLQSEVIKIARTNTDKFKSFRIIVAEGVYKKMPDETLESGSILDLAQTGRAITYELYDRNNESYNEVTYEFAEYLGEYLTGYDKIIVSYDTLDPRRGQMQSQVTVILPEVDDEFKIIGSDKPKFELATYYNNNLISKGDIVEVDPYGNVVDNNELATPEEAAGIIEYRMGAIRNKKVKPALERILAGAAKAAKVDKVIITSGLQPGKTGRRTGSTRHDTGMAADLYLQVGGRDVTLNSEAGRTIIARFVKEAYARGIRAGGMSNGYMGSRVMHLDTLGKNLGGGRFNPDVTVVWKSDSWFRSAFSN